jgi:hypothetical protein
MNEVGELRPSQLVFTFGVGAMVDLPSLSVLVMGLNDWKENDCLPLTDRRLLTAVQNRLGAQVKKLVHPPFAPDEATAGARTLGVPVATFPRWMRCPFCNTLATVDGGVFKLIKDPYRPERTRYVHENCTKAKRPTVLPVRFVLACSNGHLADFPWIEYVHDGATPCQPSQLKLYEVGASGEATNIFVECTTCKKVKPLAPALGNTDDDKPSAGRQQGGWPCPGHHPHLRSKEVCSERARVILLGASNGWFPVVFSGLALPEELNTVESLIAAHWSLIEGLDSQEQVKGMFALPPSMMPQLTDLRQLGPEVVWNGIQSRRTSHGQPVASSTEDLKTPEWQLFSADNPTRDVRDFKTELIQAPTGFEAYFERTVLVHKLREVRALVGFTRVESAGDGDDYNDLSDDRCVRLRREPPSWVPGTEVRGEGIFLQFSEKVIDEWLSRSEVKALEKQFYQSHTRWREMRKLPPPHQAGYPGLKYVLIHSLSHALLREIALECGYTAASIRERIYCRSDEEKGGPMAGLLLYTAAADSEGTLGGLVSLGEPRRLGQIMSQALESMRICTSDPLCSEHEPSKDGRTIHAACCHGCLFAAETSCERGNRYLDRSVLVNTFAKEGRAFFNVTG